MSLEGGRQVNPTHFNESTSFKAGKLLVDIYSLTIMKPDGTVIQATSHTVILLLCLRSTQWLSLEDLSLSMFIMLGKSDLEMMVPPDSIKSDIYKLRVWLGDDINDPQFIETKIRTGYKLIE
jgi:DNA-binding response OmpR family regulator